MKWFLFLRYYHIATVGTLDPEFANYFFISIDFLNFS